MTIRKNAAGEQFVKMSHTEWKSIGEDAGWFKESQIAGSQIDSSMGMAAQDAENLAKILLDQRRAIMRRERPNTQAISSAMQKVTASVNQILSGIR